MSLSFIAALILAASIGVSLGLLGGGGSILAVPMLVYVAGVDAHEAIAMSLAIVGATSLVGSALHARAARVDFRVAVLFGGSGAAGAFLGARLTQSVSDRLLLVLFALLMIVVSVLMLLRRGADGERRRPGRLGPTIAAGLGVGVLTGFLGVGGGFLIVPALVLLAGLPMPMAVGTSLVVIAANCAAGVAGHLSQGLHHVDLMVLFTGLAVVGSLVGVRIAGRVSATALRRAFALFVLAVGLSVLVANANALLG